MYPQKADKLIPGYAQEAEIPLADIEYMVHTMFQYLKDTMATYDHNKIRVEGLGIFFFRVWKIEPEVRKCNNILRKAALPVMVLEDIQDKRMNLIKMDAIIMHEMSRRDDLIKQARNNIHVGSANNYRQKICRCKECKREFAADVRGHRESRKGRKEREEYRLQKLQEYEAKRKTAKGMGE